MSHASDRSDGGAVQATTPLEEAQRRRRGVQAALIDLEQAIAAPSTGRERAWIERVSGQLDVLATAFGYHVEATEERGGLFDEVVSQAPRLTRQVDYLRADHVRLAGAIEAAQRIARDPAAEGHLLDLADAGADLLARLTRHRHLGSTMVFEAYMVDIDAAD